MSALAIHGAAGVRPSSPPGRLTEVELVWREKQIEHWIRFGHAVHEQILDRRRRVLSFPAGAVFAFVRWASNGFGTVVSRIDILRAVSASEGYQTLPSTGSPSAMRSTATVWDARCLSGEAATGSARANSSS